MDRQANGAADAEERLARALDMLEARIERHVAAARSADQLREEIEALTADRSRLAHELDSARARASRLEQAAGHAEERVEAAIGTIQSVLGER